MNQGILLSADIDFMIHGIFQVEVFGQKVWITTSHACILIVMALMLIFAIVANRKMKHATDKPDAFQNVIELIVEMLDGMVESTMGKWAPKFVNYISTIFVFILMSNISGLVGLRPPTADYGTTFALALITFFMIRVCKVKHQSKFGKVYVRLYHRGFQSGRQSTLSARLRFRFLCRCVCSQTCFQER